MKAADTEFYTLHVAGVTRALPKIKISDKLAIASFVMLGDTELVEKAAQALYEHPNFPRYEIDVLVCPEAKAIPLTQVLANLLHVNYIVVRKSVKAYMRDPVVESVKSITTTEEQVLVMNGADADRIRGRNVCIVDDVVSTGGSLKALDGLLAQTGCKVIARAAVLLEEGGYKGDGLIYLDKLPVFPV
jgi:adenine phosphoribosyltransferase